MASADTKPTDLKFKDLTGATFGRLSVLGWHGRAKSNPGESLWLCRCACGKERIVWGMSLRTGRTLSCGCHAKEAVKRASTTHGHSYSLTYSSWRSMRVRCLYPTAINYSQYGGAGITVCNRWEKFKNFLADMGERPSKRHTLDRYPNGNGNYEPGNVRWATWEEQLANRDITRLATLNGETLSLSGWAKRIGLTRASIYYRIRNGWSVKDAITTPRHINRS